MRTVLIEKPLLKKSKIRPDLWHCVTAVIPSVGPLKCQSMRREYTGVGRTDKEAWQDLFHLLWRAVGYHTYVYPEKEKL